MSFSVISAHGQEEFLSDPERLHLEKRVLDIRRYVNLRIAAIAAAETVHEGDFFPKVTNDYIDQAFDSTKQVIIDPMLLSETEEIFGVDQDRHLNRKLFATQDVILSKSRELAGDGAITHEHIDEAVKQIGYADSLAA